MKKHGIMKYNDIYQGQSGQDVANNLNAALEYLIKPPIVDTSINYAINGEIDKIILVTTRNEDVIITLPTLDSDLYEHNIFIIIKIDSGTGRVIINGNGDDLVLGESFVTLSYQYEIYKLLKYQSLWIPIY